MTGPAGTAHLVLLYGGAAARVASRGRSKDGVADATERARRRRAERPEIGAEALATDLRLRDERDAAQMQSAPDAETIDTTELNVDEVVDRIERLVEARAGA